MLGKGTKDKDFANAEAAGHLKSMPMSKANMVETSAYEEKVVDNPEDFRIAIGHAQMAGKDFVEVSEELFNYLVKNNPTEYITYGSPGVKVFKEGTRAKIESLERLSPEESNRQRLFGR